MSNARGTVFYKYIFSECLNFGININYDTKTQVSDFYIFFRAFLMQSGHLLLFKFKKETCSIEILKTWH